MADYFTHFPCLIDVGTPDNAIIRFVLRLAEELDLSGIWGFEHANPCSRPRTGAFGGGAHVIDLGARTKIGWTNTQEWLASALNGENFDA